MRYTIFLLVFLYAFVGCSEDNANSDTIFVNFGEEFELEVKQKAVVTGNESGEVTDSLLVELTTLQDNRCPEGIICVVAGAVQAQLTISTTQQTEKIMSCIGSGCGLLDEKPGNESDYIKIDTSSFYVDNSSYQLIFKDAVPFPKVDGKKSNNGAERAILEVIRQ